MRVCVVGLGKIGLPLAAQYASKGLTVIGCDINKKVANSINKGISHIKEEPELENRVKRAVKTGLLSATTDITGAVKKSDVVVAIVPLGIDKRKNINYKLLDSATGKIARGLQKGTLVICETTLPVGDTRERILPLLEKSGLLAGKDFFLAYSPERVSSGTIFLDLKRYPKIIGGIDGKSTTKAVQFYKRALNAKIVPMESSEEAEAVKLFGMVYRDVNIALANEFAKFSQTGNIDIYKVIEASNTNPHSHILQPGCGVGGHCAPVYPYFLMEKSKVNLNLPKIARKINDSMPAYTINLLKKEFGKLSGKRVLVLGLSFRPKTKELKLSPSIEIIKILKRNGAKVYAHDPLFSDNEIKNQKAIPANIKKLPKLDSVILTTNHDSYKNLNFNSLKSKGVKLIVDGRNALDRKKVESAGIDYIGVGDR